MNVVKMRLFMEGEICKKKCDQIVKVFIKCSDKRQLCYACVVRLRTERLEYSEKQQNYYFNGNKRNKGLNFLKNCGIAYSKS
jgi:hypothetical protein